MLNVRGRGGMVLPLARRCIATVNVPEAINVRARSTYQLSDQSILQTRNKADTEAAAKPNPPIA
jgi:hypothetical protein